MEKNKTVIHDEKTAETIVFAGERKTARSIAADEDGSITAFAEVGGEIAAPVGSDYMIVRIVSESGAAYADDVSVRLK